MPKESIFEEWNDIVTNCVKEDVATISCIPAVFSNLLTSLLMFVGFFALIIFIFGGYKYMNSGGDPKKLESARNNLVYGILGLLLVLFSFLIINVTSIVTGVECITKFGFGCN